ncbi:MAG: IPT/TIG domain-containing protein, partial [Tannerella sp.]|nr:IPT/TIG domain-containing protein [Tannerella sp.]
SKPVIFTSFIPAAGKIRERVIIKGSNFGNDASKMKVLFKDNAMHREATIINVTNEAIYCLAPRQTSGNNLIRLVTANGDTIDSNTTFNYTAVEMITTYIIGVSGTGKDGKLSEATVDYSDGVADVGNESALIFESINSAVRFVSVPDNMVTTVHTAFCGGKPAITGDKTKVFSAGRAAPHTVYMYTKESGWSPSRVGELGTLSTQAEDYVGALAMTEDEEWVYFCSTKGVFGRFKVGGSDVGKLEIINDKTAVQTSYETMPTGSYNNPHVERTSFLVYDPFKRCFYLSVTAAYSIYKLDMQGNAELYAGLSTKSSVVDGYIGETGEATFAMPHGMALDADGNLYVCDGSRSSGQVIRKISTNGYVSTVAGALKNNMPAITEVTDGISPLTAVFRYPTDICFNGENGFWIFDGWARRLRKYAIE